MDRVRERLLRAARALRGAKVSYAVIGGNAVAAWVATVDVDAVRNTQSVDVLVQRADLDAVRAALEAAGFHYRHAAGLDLFLDSPTASPRSAVHLAFTGELVKPAEPVANPSLAHVVDTGDFVLLSLEDIVRIKLTAFRDKDRMHLRDLIDVRLVDASWIAPMRALHPRLGDRLEEILASSE